MIKRETQQQRDEQAIKELARILKLITTYPTNSHFDHEHVHTIEKALHTLVGHEIDHLEYETDVENGVYKDILNENDHKSNPS